MTSIPDMFWQLCLVAGCSWVGCALIIRVSRHLALLDTPGERSSHRIPTPTSGGLAIIASMLFALWGLKLAGNNGSLSDLAIGMLILSLLGWADDRFGLPVVVRLIVQFAVVGWLLSQQTDVPASGMVVLGIVAVGLINIFNFMDGIDGIAGQQAVFVALVTAAVASSAVGAFYLAGAAAVAGFLLWNAPPASLFMGDSGSLPLGLMLVMPAVGAIPDVVNIEVVLIAWTLFVVDGVITLADRALRKESLFRAHRDHIYQRLSRAIGSHRPVTGLYLLINLLWCLPAALVARSFPESAHYILAICWSVTFVCALFALQKLKSVGQS